MPIEIGPGWTIGPGIQIGGGAQPVITFIDTENDNQLTTESGDNLITES